jgi:SAM-dependent methyltransferase
MSAQTSSQEQPAGLAGVPKEWAEDHIATIFSRWHPFLAPQERESEALVIAESGAKRGDTVLDVACGTGVPTLRLAEKVGRDGRVVAIDPSPVFLAAAADNARARGLTNIEFIRSSAATLPFDRASFDAATCHMGVMFFTDLNAGLTRIREVLKPGARAAFVAWGPDEDNELFGSFWSAARPYYPPPAAPDPSIPEADIPKPNRFAPAGSLSRALTQAGYRAVRERSEQVNLVWPGHAPSSFVFWTQLTNANEQVPAERRAALEQDVLASLGQYAERDTLHFRSKVVVASGVATSG